MGVILTALGRYLPEKIMTNRDLEQIVDTSDEWIRSRTGIQERRIAAPEESTSVLAIKAAQETIRKRGIDPAEIDLVLVATMMADSPFPSTACKVQHAIGATNAAAFDLAAACSGFVYTLETAAQFIKAGTMKNALVIGSEVYSRFLDWEDRATCVLFGDGAAAAFLEADTVDHFLGSVLRSDGSGETLLHMPGGGTAMPASPETIENRQHFLKMKGLELFQQVVPMVCDALLDTTEKAGVDLSDVALIVPHQANVHIIEAVSDALGIPMDKFMINIEKYGNTSAASVPLALIDASEQNRLQPGDLVLMVGFGAGLTVAASLIRWSPAFVA
ncbi:ketoacyl-ACP synthase III [Tumebacillus sp. ITR2]|uniref:Beta-ketoacyl-[acyl-carrier-protein] synthase III n=1 Tax=Tumebacillus amylolyticus TaxID=2801339 RepID=A0ABS1JDC6_9BACL|nr:beta-ketoacyl-ACP synthase III [Tumebacillus amylolyticus]MBL0387613.1 ketoacyl-ACP synthase III [Tumebacillus amylolyticus]